MTPSGEDGHDDSQHIKIADFSASLMKLMQGVEITAIRSVRVLVDKGHALAPLAEFTFGVDKCVEIMRKYLLARSMLGYIYDTVRSSYNTVLQQILTKYLLQNDEHFSPFSDPNIQNHQSLQNYIIDMGVRNIIPCSHTPAKPAAAASTPNHSASAHQCSQTSGAKLMESTL